MQWLAIGLTVNYLGMMLWEMFLRDQARADKAFVLANVWAAAAVVIGALK